MQHLAIRYDFKDGSSALQSTDCLLQEICCPPDTTCCGSLQTSSHVFCCPNAFSCSDSMVQCPVHTFECPASVGGGCCAIGLRCASDLCFDYHYKTLAVFQPLPMHNSTYSISPDSYDCIIPTTMGLVQRSGSLSSVFTDGTGPTCASQKCQPENISQKGQDVLISDTSLGTSIAWGAKIGEIAVESQAEEKWDGKNAKRRLRRLGCVVMGLLVITVVMFVF